MLEVISQKPPRARIQGPYSDQAIALELYGDATAKVTHSAADFTIVEVDLARIKPDWRFAFGLDAQGAPAGDGAKASNGNGAQQAKKTGYGFLFITFEQLPEIGAASNVIRKVGVMPQNFGSLFRPQLGPLLPASPSGTASAIDHVMATNPNASPFLSASDRPFGAMSIEGKPVLIDVSKLTTLGGKVVETKQIVAELSAYAAKNPASKARVDKLIWAMQQEGEVLITKGVPQGAAKPITGTAHAGTIKVAERQWGQYKDGTITANELERALADLDRGYGKARMVGRVGRVLTVVGIVFTVIDVAKAGERSYEQNSAAPLGAEAIRQVGGWGGAIAGAKIGGVLGAAFGIETGPGAIITGGVGAIIFGTAGYFGADWIADQISPN